MELCVQWKIGAHWMKQNHVDVEAEFPGKVKENDEMMEKLGQDNKLEYLRVMSDLYRRKEHSNTFFKTGKGYQFKKPVKVDRKYEEKPQSQD
jgi:hypothetical protein